MNDYISKLFKAFEKRLNAEVDYSPKLTEELRKDLSNAFITYKFINGENHNLYSQFKNIT